MFLTLKVKPQKVSFVWFNFLIGKEVENTSCNDTTKIFQNSYHHLAHKSDKPYSNTQNLPNSGKQRVYINEFGEESILSESSTENLQNTQLEISEVTKHSKKPSVNRSLPNAYVQYSKSK